MSKIKFFISTLCFSLATINLAHALPVGIQNQEIINQIQDMISGERDFSLNPISDGIPTSDPYPACFPVPTCESLGYTYPVADGCPHGNPGVKCPMDTSLMFCPTDCSFYPLSSGDIIDGAGTTKSCTDNNGNTTYRYTKCNKPYHYNLETHKCEVCPGTKVYSHGIGCKQPRYKVGDTVYWEEKPIATVVEAKPTGQNTSRISVMAMKTITNPDYHTGRYSPWMIYKNGAVRKLVYIANKLYHAGFKCSSKDGSIAQLDRVQLYNEMSSFNGAEYSNGNFIAIRDYIANHCTASDWPSGSGLDLANMAMVYLIEGMKWGDALDYTTSGTRSTVENAGMTLAYRSIAQIYDDGTSPYIDQVKSDTEDLLDRDWYISYLGYYENSYEYWDAVALKTAHNYHPCSGNHNLCNRWLLPSGYYLYKAVELVDDGVIPETVIEEDEYYWTSTDIIESSDGTKRTKRRRLCAVGLDDGLFGWGSVKPRASCPELFNPYAYSHITLNSGNPSGSVDTMYGSSYKLILPFTAFDVTYSD